jgi:hypothetical protein
MIHDGLKKFPLSVVKFTKFRSYELQQMFAYLRERESIFQTDIEKYRGTLKEELCRAQLHEIEAQLVYMATNLTGDSNEVYRRQLGLF